MKASKFDKLLVFRVLYSSILRSGQAWEREVMKGRAVLGEQTEIARLKSLLPERVASLMALDDLGMRMAMDGKGISRAVMAILEKRMANGDGGHRKNAMDRDMAMANDRIGSDHHDAGPLSPSQFSTMSVSVAFDGTNAMDITDNNGIVDGDFGGRTGMADQKWRLLGNTMNRVLKDAWRKYERTHAHINQDEALDDCLSVLRELNNRTSALQKLVYNVESENMIRDVKIHINSFPFPLKPSPSTQNNDEKKYTFGYYVTIENTNPTKVFKILSRHWSITDGEGNVEETEGPIIKDKQPELGPGEKLSYSACGGKMDTTYGTASATYHLLDTQSGETFDIEVPSFGLNFNSPHTQPITAIAHSTPAPINPKEFTVFQ